MRNIYIRLIVIAYFSLNILSVIFYCTIPNENFVKSKSSLALNQFENMKNEIMNNPQLLTLRISDDKYNIKNYNFDYEGKDLEISIAKGGHNIFINRKAADDNKIEVYWYPGPIAVNGIDFTSVLKDPNINLNKSKLDIKYEKQTYSFIQFSKDITIHQFYEKKDNENNNRGTSFGSGILYIRIPKNLKILGNKEYQYLP
jgi:hypothetical protein